MGYGVVIGGLWRPKKQAARSVASGMFSLPCDLVLSAGHRFVVTARQKSKANEPDYDLWLFGQDDESTKNTGGFESELPDEPPSADVPPDDVPF